jgi:hypothetical protein
MDTFDYFESLHLSAKNTEKVLQEEVNTRSMLGKELENVILSNNTLQTQNNRIQEAILDLQKLYENSQEVILDLQCQLEDSNSRHQDLQKLYENSQEVLLDLQCTEAHFKSVSAEKEYLDAGLVQLEDLAQTLMRTIDESNRGVCMYMYTGDTSDGQAAHTSGSAYDAREHNDIRHSDERAASRTCDLSESAFKESVGDERAAHISKAGYNAQNNMNVHNYTNSNGDLDVHNNTNTNGNMGIHDYNNTNGNMDVHNNTNIDGNMDDKKHARDMMSRADKNHARDMTSRAASSKRSSAQRSHQFINLTELRRDMVQRIEMLGVIVASSSMAGVGYASEGVNGEPIVKGGVGYASEGVNGEPIIKGGAALAPFCRQAERGAESRTCDVSASAFQESVAPDLAESRTRDACASSTLEICTLCRDMTQLIEDIHVLLARNQFRDATHTFGEQLQSPQGFAVCQKEIDGNRTRDARTVGQSSEDASALICQRTDRLVPGNRTCDGSTGGQGLDEGTGIGERTDRTGPGNRTYDETIGSRYFEEAGEGRGRLSVGECTRVIRDSESESRGPLEFRMSVGECTRMAEDSESELRRQSDTFSPISIQGDVLAEVCVCIYIYIYIYIYMYVYIYVYSILICAC